MNESNPILNSPYQEPRWHYATDLQGNLNYEDIRKDRRVFDPNIGGQSMPVQRQKQGSLLEVNEFAGEYGTQLINLLRQEVGRWRKAEYPDTTGATRDLLRYWFLNPERHATRSLFFAQREAIETAIWLNEVASKSNAGNNILNKLKEELGKADDALPRICLKMATGTGKTVVMAALMLYHYFNRQEYRQDTRFCDYFLLVAPGITIKDRLGVLYVDNTTHDKNKAKDYYRERDLVPPRFERLLDGLNARLVITNYHTFEPRTLQGNKRSVFDGKIGADGKKQEGKEEMTQVIKRLLKNFRKGSRLLVLNDEAHHCYLPRVRDKSQKDIPGDDNVKEENERAAVWYITRHLINLYFHDDENGKAFHLFGQLKQIVADWYRDKIVVIGGRPEEVNHCKKLEVNEDPKKYCSCIYEAIQNGSRNRGEMRVLPVFNYYNKFSSTRYIHGHTAKPCQETAKSHVNVVVADAISTNPEANFWEHVTAKTLEELPEVQSYFKNAFSDFQIPYVADGKDRYYKPDFIIRSRRPNGTTVMLILEITGANKQYKVEKKLYTETYWIPAVNAVRDLYPELGGCEWRFLEVSGEVRELKTNLVNSFIKD